MQSLKIIILTDVFLPYKGGGQIWVWEMAKRLVTDYGVEVEIVTRKLLLNGECSFDFQVLFNGKLKITRLGFCATWNNLFSRILFIFQSFLYLLGRDFDVIDAEAFISGFSGKAVSLFKNKPVIYGVHGTNMDRGNASFLEKILLTKIKYTAQVSDASNFLNYNNININKKVFSVDPGVDLDIFKPKFEIKEKNRILFSGRICREKGIDTLMKLIYDLRGHDLRFVIIGDGEEKEKLKTYVSNNRLQNVILMNSLSQDQLAVEYQKSDILLLPSHFDGLPLSILEAKACGAAIIASDLGDVKRVVKNRVNGFLVRHDDYEGFKTAIINLTSDEKLKINCQLKNIKDAKNYSWDASARKLFEIYRASIIPLSGKIRS